VVCGDGTARQFGVGISSNTWEGGTVRLTGGLKENEGDFSFSGFFKLPNLNSKMMIQTCSKNRAKMLVGKVSEQGLHWSKCLSLKLNKILVMAPQS
jgi:hypothetical protein